MHRSDYTYDCPGPPNSSLQSHGTPADKQGMTRTLGLPLLLVSLLIGGYLFTQQTKSTGPRSDVVTQAETQAQQYAAATNFQPIAPLMDAAFAANGTYAGAELPLGSGVTLVRADATSYCLQTTGDATAVMHDAGPNGTVQPGPC
jgi:hypothetical protein